MVTKELKLTEADNNYMKNMGSINVHFPPVLRAKAELLVWLRWQRERYKIQGYVDCVKICDDAIKRNEI